MHHGDHETDLDAHLSAVRQRHCEADGNRLVEVREVWLELTDRVASNRFGNSLFSVRAGHPSCAHGVTLLMNFLVACPRSVIEKG